LTGPWYGALERLPCWPPPWPPPARASRSFYLGPATPTDAVGAHRRAGPRGTGFLQEKALHRPPRAGPDGSGRRPRTSPAADPPGRRGPESQAGGSQFLHSHPGTRSSSHSIRRVGRTIPVGATDQLAALAGRRAAGPARAPARRPQDAWLHSTGAALVRAHISRKGDEGGVASGPALRGGPGGPQTTFVRFQMGGAHLGGGPGRSRRRPPAGKISVHGPIFFTGQ